MAEQLLSVAEVAELWHCSRGHVYDLIAAGKLPSVDIGINRAKTRIPAVAVDEYVKARTRSARTGRLPPRQRDHSKPWSTSARVPTVGAHETTDSDGRANVRLAPRQRWMREL